MFTNNGYNSLYDILSGDAKQFKEQLESRNKKLSQIGEVLPEVVLFEPLKSKPRTLFVTDISEDPNYWTNRGYNEYYNLRHTKIYITKPTDEKID